MADSKLATFMRSSKFHHLFGQVSTKDQSYYGIHKFDIRTEKGSTLAANSKYVAVILGASKGLSFLVHPLEKKGRIDDAVPVVYGHKHKILVLKWCPHNDHMIASASENGSIKIWMIPDGGLKKNLTEPQLSLENHDRKLTIIEWHPSAANILLSGSQDPKICIWNLDDSSCEVEICDLPDIPCSAAWNYDGSRIVVTCKDKNFRVYNPRTGDIIVEGPGHEGSKPFYAIYLRNGNIFTTGFSKMSERQYAVWNGNDLKQLNMTELDTANGTLIPFYDGDSNLVYLCAKGDSNMRYYKLVDEDPYYYYIATLTTAKPCMSICMMSKRGVNVRECEVARFFRTLRKQDVLQVISVTVPRDSDGFQKDLYPDTPGNVAALTSSQWFEGKDSDPLLIPWTFDDVEKSSTSTTQDGDSGTVTAATSGEKSSSQTSSSSQEESVEDKPGVIADLERRVKQLENMCAKMMAKLNMAET